ncbi:ATPase, T2SS/T4P/T4SS family [Vibrio sp. D431a]|uniref:ATPase, T2SS/T4P/T4SS family n=1 Tax=Vibrio sp. D431a TaxID=2837388 RepID=UPI002555E90D|nr:ATPase, T2SS/T4P/T4SS family [Vibrio sp. D431a]MDK9793850.1 Flp pilus assembly complex ATPase component TadA [Vibrio sp. D431a]
MEETKKVFDPLDFTDIYINFSDVNKSNVYYRDIEECMPVCDALKPHVQKLAQQISEIAQKRRGSFTVQYNRKFYRCQLIRGIHGLIADLRAQPMETIPLSQISIPLKVKQVCTARRLNRGGLIIVAGSPGQGKTTTCAAIILERLKKFGGFCLAIEDPAELPLDGVHGKGRLVQMEIHQAKDYIDAGRMAMRCYPTDKPGLMFISEIRDSEAAALALRSSLDGRLVIATVHADNPISALKRVITYASSVMDEKEAIQLLYSGFRLCLHQERTGSRINSTILVDTPSVVPLIKNGKFDMLGTEIDLQQRLLKEDRPIKTRDS